MARVINWNENFDSGTGPDGTSYMIQSEVIRFEPKWWYGQYFDPCWGTNGTWRDLPNGDQGHSKMGQVARCERDAKQRMKEKESSQ